MSPYTSNERGFFIPVLLDSLQCTHLCIKIIKNTEVGVAPLPNALAPFAQAIGQRGPLWEQIYLANN